MLHIETHWKCVSLAKSFSKVWNQGWPDRQKIKKKTPKTRCLHLLHTPLCHMVCCLWQSFNGVWCICVDMFKIKLRTYWAWQAGSWFWFYICGLNDLKGTEQQNNSKVFLEWLTFCGAGFENQVTVDMDMNRQYYIMGNDVFVHE